MATNEKAALNGCDIENGKEKISGQAKTFPMSDNITTDKAPQGIVESVLQHGAENAIKSRDIMRRLGISDERHFRELVERERENSVILSCSRGLYLPAYGAAGRAELTRYIKTGTARIAGQARALKSAKTMLKAMEIDGQETIQEGAADNDR